MKSLILNQFQTKTNPSIHLETSKGNMIDNYQVTELSAFEQNMGKDYEKYEFATPRSSMSPMYNCHGMTFASRRTCIDKSEEIRKILKDDGYKDVTQKPILSGDIVLYLDSDSEIVHSATVVSIDNSTSIPTIRVMSKWGKWREYIHDLHICPYTNTRKEFWRLTHEQYEKKI